MAPTIRWALALSCSCAAAPGEGTGGAVAYVEAARSDPAGCDAITEDEWRRECVAMGAWQLARTGRLDDAREACGGLAEGPWRDECFFLVADGSGVHGERARTLCRDAGRWRQHCLGHAINREAKVLFETIPVGEEDRLQRELLAVVGAYLEGGEVADKARRLTVAHLAGRRADQPFGPDNCGQAERELCRDAYVERVRLASEHSDRPWRAACGSFVSPERAAGAGMPAWEPAADALVQEAWQELCRR